MSEIMAWGQGIDQRRKTGMQGWQTASSSPPPAPLQRQTAQSPQYQPQPPKTPVGKSAPAPRSAAERALASAADLPSLRRRPALPSGYEPPDYVVAQVRLTDGRVLHINAHDLADPRYVNVRNLNPDGTPVKGRAGLQARAVFDGAELLGAPWHGSAYQPPVTFLSSPSAGIDPKDAQPAPGSLAAARPAPVPAKGDPLMAVPPAHLPQISKQVALAMRDAAARELAALQKTLPPGPQRTDEQRRQVLALVRRGLKAGATAHGYNDAIEQQGSSAYRMGAQWLSGAGGDDQARFFPGSTFQEELARSPEALRARKRLAGILDRDGWAMAAGAKPGVFDSASYDEKLPATHDQRVLYRDLGEEPKLEYAKGFASDLAHNPTRAFLGSFHGKVTVDPASIDMVNRTAQAVFHARNTSSAESALRAPPPYGYGGKRSDGSPRPALLPLSPELVPSSWTKGEDWIPKAVFDSNPLGENGPMHNRSQDILWSEQIHF